MGDKIERLKRFGKAVGENLTKIGESGSRVLENLEDADKRMNEKIAKITGNV